MHAYIQLGNETRTEVGSNLGQSSLFDNLRSALHLCDGWTDTMWLSLIGQRIHTIAAEAKQAEKFMLILQNGLLSTTDVKQPQSHKEKRHDPIHYSTSAFVLSQSRKKEDPLRCH